VLVLPLLRGGGLMLLRGGGLLLLRGMMLLLLGLLGCLLKLPPSWGLALLVCRSRRIFLDLWWWLLWNKILNMTIQAPELYLIDR